MEVEFTFEQSVIPIDHKLPKTAIKKPFYSYKLLLNLDYETHAISVHIIALFYRDNKKAEGSEIDIIQIGVFNTFKKPLTELLKEELTNVLKDSADIAVKYTNEQIALKYPKIARLSFYTPSQLTILWRQYVDSLNKQSKDGYFGKPIIGDA